MTHPIRFGIQTGQQMVTWEQIREAWIKADALGYDSLWAYDHFYPIFTNPDGPCFEGWSLLGALAQCTERARIGHLVNGNTYRNPCVLAKSATTVDHISGGRLNLGIGSGWFEYEHQSLGIDFKTMRGRLEALDESCRILKGMFEEDKFSLQGKHYQVQDAMCLPKPVQSPHPPIMIGGTGKKVLLRIVARYADMWNSNKRPDEMAELIEITKRHGEEIGRDTSEIENTLMMPLGYKVPKETEDFLCTVTAGMLESTPEEAREAIMLGGKQECLDTIERYQRAGVTHFIFMLLAPYDLDQIEAFAEDVMTEFKACPCPLLVPLPEARAPMLGSSEPLELGAGSRFPAGFSHRVGPAGVGVGGRRIQWEHCTACFGQGREHG